jgi:hypothetical protein
MIKLGEALRQTALPPPTGKVTEAERERLEEVEEAGG